MRGFTALLRFGPHAFAFALGAVAAVADLPAQSAGARAVVTATEVATSGGPAGLVGAAVAPLPGGDSLLFGGAGASGVQGITYRLSGSAWTTLSPQVSPAARTDAAMVLDSARSSLLLFGGKNVLGQPLGDTWSFANGQWAQVPTPVAPPARSGHRMAFDPTGNRVLLFGGEDAAGNAFGDFWEWTGTAWNQLFPSTLPLWRSHFGMDWDRVRGRLVLFGGRAGTTRRDDLWEWNGTTWSPVLIQPNQGVVHAPSARDRLAMAWDPLSERIVLHGGDTASGCASDLWSWNGTEWTVHLPTGTSPSARGSHALWYDGRANQLRLFGGLCGTSLAGDLWSLTLPVTWRSSAYGQGCAGSAGIPIFSVRPGSEALLGRTLVCDLTSVPTTPSNPAFGLYDLQRTTFLGQSIPVSLAFAGLPGCDAWTGGSWSVQLPPMQAGVGTSLSVALPNANALLGVSLYLQSLVFDNSNGRWASMSNGLEVRIGNPIPAPVASFTASPVAGSVPLVVQFTDTSAHAPTSWQWDFDNDGVVDSTVQNPTCTYATAGLFSVRLVATSAAGADTSLRPNLVLAYSSQNPNPALNLMPIAAGTFQMGSVAVGGAAVPVHAVSITRPFWMAKYEVTQAQYQSVMGNNPSAFQGASYPDAANRPVERVSWNMAVAYCAALTAAETAAGRVPAGYQYRLPTEAEWEYCCRAGTTTEWNTGSSLSCAQANIYPCVNQTRAVGVYAANAWGLHDMHGNIWEWCLDAWDGSSTYPSSAVTDPHGTSGPFRIYRGGGWGDVSAYSRSAIRVMVEPLARGHGLGFRVVLAPVLVP